ncbi:MAG: 3-dehydroquinate synthase [Actinomycetota bacterium]|nr:3-dehydroquinate synthase [Actinomycetota bacterium]
MSTKRYDEIVVDLGDRSYPVYVGEELLGDVDSMIPDDVGKVAIVTQRNIGIVPQLTRPLEIFYIGDGEQSKSLGTIGELCSGFAEMGINRKDMILAIGGGIVSDTAGFAAATFHRGLRYGIIATTLLAQVDAAIGGKTAVNIPEGKNLVGAFWQPTFVVCDIATLETLSNRERLCGMGEMAKYAFLGAEGLDQLSLGSQISACVRVKAGFVESDEREGDRRALLNYGHTLGHAIEAVGFEDRAVNLKHGEAVAIGLIFAALLAKRLGRIDASRVDYHLRVVRSYGLPTRLPFDVDPDRLIEAMCKDKKSFGTLTFVLDGGSGVEVVRDVDPTLVREVLLELNNQS